MHVEAEIDINSTPLVGSACRITDAPFAASVGVDQLFIAFAAGLIVIGVVGNVIVVSTITREQSAVCTPIVDRHRDGFPLHHLPKTKL